MEDEKGKKAMGGGERRSERRSEREGSAADNEGRDTRERERSWRVRFLGECVYSASE